MLLVGSAIGECDGLELIVEFIDRLVVAANFGSRGGLRLGLLLTADISMADAVSRGDHTGNLLQL